MPVRAERPGLYAALLLAACAGHVPPPSPAPIPVAERTVSLFLIGDAGKPDSAGDAVLAELAHQTAAAPRGSAILFLGDNLYPRGLPAPIRAQSWLPGTNTVLRPLLRTTSSWARSRRSISFRSGSSGAGRPLG